MGSEMCIRDSSSKTLSSLQGKLDGGVEHGMHEHATQLSRRIDRSALTLTPTDVPSDQCATSGALTRLPSLHTHKAHQVIRSLDKSIVLTN